MVQGHRFEDTPSIVGREITTVRPGQTLRYSELTGREKRDYLFDQGIQPTAYEKFPGEARPEVIPGIVQFTGSAWESITNHLLAETLIRESDELERPKPKLFHTYGTTAKILFTPQPDDGNGKRKSFEKKINDALERLHCPLVVVSEPA